MKHVWRKQEKEIYGTKGIPCVIDVMSQKFITISGTGNPNNKEFSEKIAALYAVAYQIKMNYKSYARKTKKEIDDYTVYPLEGLWWKQRETEELVKEELQYKIMIRQPDFITEEMVGEALEAVKRKKVNPFLSRISFETTQDGKCVQILHTGSFDSEPATFEKLERFCKENNFERIDIFHREIYLNNANRVSAEQQKTILRYKVR